MQPILDPLIELLAERFGVLGIIRVRVFQRRRIENDLGDKITRHFVVDARLYPIRFGTTAFAQGDDFTLELVLVIDE